MSGSAEQLRFANLHARAVTTWYLAVSKHTHSRSALMRSLRQPAPGLILQNRRPTKPGSDRFQCCPQAVAWYLFS